MNLQNLPFAIINEQKQEPWRMMKKADTDPTPGFTFGWRMGLIREENGLTKSAMAKSLGIAPSTWGSYENDASFPSQETIQKFCDIYEVSYKWLMTNVGPIYQNGKNVKD